jgi:hypothetical protein
MIVILNLASRFAKKNHPDFFFYQARADRLPFMEEKLMVATESLLKGSLERLFRRSRIQSTSLQPINVVSVVALYERHEPVKSIQAQTLLYLVFSRFQTVRRKPGHLAIKNLDRSSKAGCATFCSRPALNLFPCLIVASRLG